MKHLIISLTFVLFSLFSSGQKPKNGVYYYKVVFAEWNGAWHGATCKVVIKDDSITVYHNGGNLSGKKGTVLDRGLIKKHKKTGSWIIAHSANDINAKEIGGCSEGPTIIDFRAKKFWLC